MTNRVGIVMGSKSDLSVMKKAAEILTSLEISFEMRVLSAHRTPNATQVWAESAQDRGLRVLICGAGMSAHLAGVVAAHSALPVIGVPVNASLGGIDALLSTVQMPPGVPVATVGVGGAGAKNAAWLAAKILALQDQDLSVRLESEKRKMREKVLADDKSLA